MEIETEKQKVAVDDYKVVVNCEFSWVVYVPTSEDTGDDQILAFMILAVTNDKSSAYSFVEKNFEEYDLSYTSSNFDTYAEYRRERDGAVIALKQVMPFQGIVDIEE